jgi:hypothetical protein
VYLQEGHTAPIVSGSVVGVILLRCLGCAIKAIEGCVTCRHKYCTPDYRTVC